MFRKSLYVWSLHKCLGVSILDGVLVGDDWDEKGRG